MSDKYLLRTYHKIKILFADTDAGGMMYFGQACRFVEASIHNWFQENKLSFLSETSSLFWVVRELNILYSQTISYDEDVTLSCNLDHVGRFYLLFKILFIDKQGKNKIAAQVRMASIDNQKKVPIKVPESLYTKSVRSQAGEYNEENI